MQNILRYGSPAGNRLYEVSVGALCGYPAPMVQAAVLENGLVVKTERLEGWQGFLKDHAAGLVTRVLDSAVAGDKREFARRVTAMQANGEKIARLFFLIKPAARGLSRLTARRAGKLLWMKRSEIKELPDMLALDMALEVFLSVFDGGLVRHERGSGYYKAVMKAISLTRNKKLAEAMDNILTGGEIDNNEAFLA